MNLDYLVQILNDYLEMLQASNADNDKINQVKMMIWAIEDDRKLRTFLSNLSLSNRNWR